MTRNKVKLTSKEAQAIMHQKENGLKIHLFIKKKDDENRDHYYIGELKQIDMIETSIASKDGSEKELPIVNIQYELETAVREDVYDYLVGG